MIPEWLSDALPYLVAVFVPLAYILGVISATQAIIQTRTSQGAIAWAISLISFPFLAVPLYWIFGRSRFQGYVRAHRARREELGELGAEAKAAIDRAPHPTHEPPEDHLAFERLSLHRFTGGNRFDLLIDGEATFDAIFSALSEARHYVLIEFFIVRDDDLGHRLKDQLLERAAAGVAIYFLFDAVGSRKLGEQYIEELKAAGVDARPFSTTTGIRNKMQINFRNHRKIVVVDGHLALLGGLNVGDEYLGKDPENSPWRDTHLQLRGPVVLSTQMAFLEDWNWAAGECPAEVRWDAYGVDPADMTALVVASGPADELETCGLMYVQAIHTADERLWIATPYMVPDPPAVTALQLAALRGVDVRILIPATSDSVFADLVSYTYYEELLPAGVKIYHYRPGFPHQKVMLVDDDLAAVGTANFDNRSFRLNFEITAITSDPDFVHSVEAMLENDFVGAKQVEKNEPEDWTFFFRLKTRLARLTASIQ